MLEIVPRREVDRRWREWRLRRIERGRRKHEKRLLGLGLVLRLDSGRSLEFRGRQYGVPPVPWRLAMEVLRAQERLQELQREPDWEGWQHFYRDVIRLFKRIVRPRSLIQRMLWPLLPSPIHGATPSEVGEALGFFCTFLSLDAAEKAPENPLPGTSPSTSRASSTHSPNGAMRAAR